jgi:hypothetical protein
MPGTRLVIPGSGPTAGLNAITYFGKTGITIQAIGSISVNRYGLGEGDVVWKCATSVVFAPGVLPALSSPHPVVTWLFMEKLDIEFDNAYTTVKGHYTGAYPGGTPTYDYQPSFGEEPIQTHPNFGGPTSTVDDGTIVGAAGGPILSSAITPTSNSGVVFNPDGTFKAILSGSPNNLGGVTAFLLSQGFFVKSYVSPNAPDCSDDGTITSPDGGSIPDLPGGANWLQAPTVYQQRATIFDIRVSWKASGRKGWNPIVYAA